MFLGDTILNNLLDWIKVHYEKAENQASIILEDKTVYTTDEHTEDKFSFYWDTVIGLVLQGNSDMVKMLLCNHSQSETEPFIHAMKIFKSMPTYSVSIKYFKFYLKLKFQYIKINIKFLFSYMLCS